MITNGGFPDLISGQPAWGAGQVKDLRAAGPVEGLGSGVTKLVSLAAGL